MFHKVYKVSHNWTADKTELILRVEISPYIGDCIIQIWHIYNQYIFLECKWWNQLKGCVHTAAKCLQVWTWKLTQTDTIYKETNNIMFCIKVKLEERPSDLKFAAAISQSLCFSSLNNS